MAIWASQSIQLAWFVTSTDGLNAEKFFSALVGDEPTSVQRNKIPGPTNPFLSTALGTFDSLRVQVQVQVQPGRVDLIVTPLGDVMDPSSPVALIDTETVLPLVIEGICDNAHILAPSLRLALIVNLVKPTETMMDAASLLLDRIEYNLPFNDFSDLVFQINMRKNLNDSDFIMNRLLRYSVANYQRFVMEFNANGGGGQTIPIAHEEFAASVLIDINTVPDGRIIVGDNQAPIFRELCAELLRIGVTGHVGSLA